LARLGSLEFLVKDRQSGAVSSLHGQVIRPKLDAAYLAASRRICKTAERIVTAGFSLNRFAIRSSSGIKARIFHAAIMTAERCLLFSRFTALYAGRAAGRRQHLVDLTPKLDRFELRLLTAR
jgi:hypothetical protein